MFLQRLTDEQKADLATAVKNLRSYDELKNDYPVIGDIGRLLSAPGVGGPALMPKNVLAVLKMSVILHGNAKALKATVTALPQADRLDGMTELQRLMDALGLGRNLWQVGRNANFAMDPEAFEDFLTMVMEVVADRWKSLSGDAELAALIDTMFNHSKGYDTSVDIIVAERQRELLKGSSTTLVTMNWLDGVKSNTDVFSGLSIPRSATYRTQTLGHFAEADAGKDYFTKGYASPEITEEQKKLYWTSLVNAFVHAHETDWPNAQDYLDAHLAEIKAVLGSLPSTSDADQYLGDISTLF